MLIKVFGIWLMASNINYLRAAGDECRVYVNTSEYGKSPLDYKRTCDEVAAEINKQITDRE